MLVDSVVTNCTAGEKAGGVYVTKGTFRRNLVTDCRAVSVGGAYFASATTVADAVFRCTPRLPDVAFAIMRSAKER